MAKQSRQVSRLARLTILVATGVALSPTGIVAQTTLSKSPPPSFIDDRRLPLTDAEARAKAESDRVKAAEEEAKQQVEDERRRAAEAEAAARAQAEERQRAEAKAQADAKAVADAKAKADAEAKARAEQQAREDGEARAKAAAQAKQKADAERRQAADAEAKRKSEDERAKAAEAKQSEARAKEEDDRRAAAAASSAQANTRSPAPSAAGCADDKIAAQAISGGRVSIDVTAPCRPGQSLVLRYGTYAFPHVLDGAGRTTAVLDLFQGKTAPVSLQLGDGPRQTLSLDAVDLSGLSKIAVVWRAPVDLDLHIYEYAARHGGVGHVWSGAPSSVQAAEAEAAKERRGRGFLSSESDGRGAGDKVEVYTFLHNGEQQSGLIATALDYKTRGATAAGEACGSGANAAVVYDAIILTIKGEVSREHGSITAVPCGTQLSAASRYLGDAILDLSVRP